ncbi:MAG: hypothetical protein MZV64_72750 [Ignavibacteriales bacterium]|nr:hypothetical protein [Ignavibacteriales bacterium]
MQVNIAPYDVRQGNFVGAGVNTVTRSGGNAFHGSAFYQWRERRPGGHRRRRAWRTTPARSTSTTRAAGCPGPIVKNKLFFFVNYRRRGEHASRARRSRRTRAASRSVGNTTRVLASDLNALSAFLKSKFNYDTGPLRGLPVRDARRGAYLIRADYNLNSTEQGQRSATTSSIRTPTSCCRTRRRSASAPAARNTTGLNFESVELPDHGEHPLVHRRVERRRSAATRPTP